MTAKEIREKYLEFFKSKNHSIVPSASLLPENDPSTLFTGSGMQPMVPYLLGEKHPAGTRIVDSQKCFRTMDIEDVGDNRHTTFFEMLGNWSLGDYFKKEQIEWMFEFLTEKLKLDPKRIYVSVYRGNEKYGIPKDEEAVLFWQEQFKKHSIEAKAVDYAEKEGMREGRIFYYNEKENWWSRAGVPENMPEGEPGGPDSEMFWDFGADLKLHENSQWANDLCHPACDCGRFLEIGNNVFMQYLKTKDGFCELENKNIDFGGGLERLAVAIADNPDIFLGDLFALLRGRIEEISGKKYGTDNKETMAFRVIMDHLRAAVFLVGDGAVPSNKDQGYFTRRLIRRSVRFAYSLGIDFNFSEKAAEVVISEYADYYDDLGKNKEKILLEIGKEEDKFRQTLKLGLKKFEEFYKSYLVANKNKNKITPAEGGKFSFELFQTYGFPIEMTLEELEARGMIFDKEKLIEEFDLELKKHKTMSRTASAGKFKGGLADSSKETTELHTAAHLLLEALRRVLGDHVSQKGSNITRERLRFDFSHDKAITEEEKTKVEKLINEAIERALPVSFEEMTLEKAKELGVMGVFESKYGEKVKVYKVGKGEDAFSCEICGGPHVENIGSLGRFKIKKEKSSSAGVRRIKAVLEK